MSEEVISAHTLLDRESDPAYIAEWTILLQQRIALEKETDEQSVVVFRLGGEWLAIPPTVFAEIAHVRPWHRIPHRKNPFLLGIISLRGTLRICVSLHRLLELEEQKSESKDHKQYARMVAIRKGAQHWIFPVDEVYGNFRYKKAELQNVPVTVAKSTANYLRGVMAWEGRSVGVLDEDLLLQSLSRSLQ